MVSTYYKEKRVRGSKKGYKNKYRKEERDKKKGGWMGIRMT